LFFPLPVIPLLSIPFSRWFHPHQTAPELLPITDQQPPEQTPPQQQSISFIANRPARQDRIRASSNSPNMAVPTVPYLPASFFQLRHPSLGRSSSLPPATWTEEKKTNKRNRSTVKQIQKKEWNIFEKRKEGREHIWKRKKKLKSIVLCIFLLLQVTVFVTASEERKKGGSCSRSSGFSRVFLRGCVNPCTASGGGTWDPRAAIVPALPEVFLCNSWIFRGLFCNLWIVYYVVRFVLNLWYFISCKNNVWVEHSKSDVCVCVFFSCKFGEYMHMVCCL
jgi:hypothetical protein